MKSEWKTAKVGDYVSFQNGYAFKSNSFIDNGNYYVIRIKELKNGEVKFFPDSAKININNCAELEKYKINYGDVLFALTGDPVNRNNPLSWVGRISIYRHDKMSYLNQRVCKAIFNDKINPLYFYYYFNQYDMLYSLAAKATGSASQANISTKTISEMSICLPSLPNQTKIATILNTIDSKIETNNRINKNLLN